MRASTSRTVGPNARLRRFAGEMVTAEALHRHHRALPEQFGGGLKGRRARR